MKTLLFSVFLILPFIVSAQTPWVAPPDSKEIINPFTDNEQAIERGSEIFDLLCSVCHGETGMGDGVTLEYLNPKPANLTSKKVQSQTAGEIYWKVTTGRPPMQSYVNVLSVNETWQVISFIKTFGVE